MLSGRTQDCGGGGCGGLGEDYRAGLWGVGGGMFLSELPVARMCSHPEGPSPPPGRMVATQARQRTQSECPTRASSRTPVCVFQIATDWSQEPEARKVLRSAPWGGVRGGELRRSVGGECEGGSCVRDWVEKE